MRARARGFIMPLLSPGRLTPRNVYREIIVIQIFENNLPNSMETDRMILKYLYNYYVYVLDDTQILSGIMKPLE